MDTISLFRAFIRVVEAGSFTRVAQEQNSSQPTVSRQVAALEEHLGARLFTRTTRKLTSSAILFARQNLEQRFAIDTKLNPRRG